MSVNLRYPNITGKSEKEQITQIKSYLHQLVDHMNYALPTLKTESESKQEETSKTYEVQGSEMSYYDLRSLVMQELQEVQNMVDNLEAAYVKRSGWPADRYMATDANGNVIAGKLTFTLDENGNLYYELEE